MQPHGENGWFPSQKLTRQEALKGFTIDAAYAAFNETIVSLFYYSLLKTVQNWKLSVLFFPVDGIHFYRKIRGFYCY